MDAVFGGKFVFGHDIFPQGEYYGLLRLKGVGYLWVRKRGLVSKRWLVVVHFFFVFLVFLVVAFLALAFAIITSSRLFEYKFNMNN